MAIRTQTEERRRSDDTKWAADLLRRIETKVSGAWLTTLEESKLSALVGEVANCAASLERHSTSPLVPCDDCVFFLPLHKDKQVYRGRCHRSPDFPHVRIEQLGCGDGVRK